VTAWRLVADVGGTNVRFARATDRTNLKDKIQFPVTAYASFDDALSAYLDEVASAGPCHSAAIAGAGPVDRNQIEITNNDWKISAEAVSEILWDAPVSLYNDLQAAALSIPVLPSYALNPVIEASEEPNPRASRLAVNVGTGFGASPVVRTDSGWYALAGEAGHMNAIRSGIDKTSPCFQDTHSLTSVEDILSGRGIQALYAYFSGQMSDQIISPQAIFNEWETDPTSAKACDAFTHYLAEICGDLVLAYGAWGGVYLFGSVALEWSRHGASRSFCETFTDKGMMSSRVAKVPIYGVTISDAPLIGMACSSISSAVRIS
jgi:glucokinase